jgi:hypothetical protein
VRAGWTADLEVETRRPDSAARTFIDAEVELRADYRRRRAQWELSDSVSLVFSDFPASNVLDAAAETTVAVVANAPAGNELYQVHWSVQITPVVPGGGTNTHVVVVALESNADAAGWIERALFRYEVIRIAGQSAAVVRWPHETEAIRVLGLDNNDEIRLRVKSASGPGGWAFQVHGFNVATNGDPTGGLTYHTGLAVDLFDDGGVALADLITTKIESATSDGYETDLGGPPWVPSLSEYAVAEYNPKDATSGEVVDRFIAYLNPRVDGGQPRTVAQWVCQPFEVTVASTLGDLASMVPLATPVVVAAQDGDTAEEIVFDWASLKGGIGQRGVDHRPRVRGGGGALNDELRSLWFVWALKADGTPATNVGWGKNSGASSVTSGARYLGGRTITANPFGLPEGWYLGGLRNVPRCRIEGGAYPSSATLDFVGGGTRFDLGAAPTQTVQFTCRGEVPLGCALTFQVRNDADSAWVTVTDGQSTADVGLTATQTRKFQVILAANAAGTQTPILVEFGMREVQVYPLHHCARLEQAAWSVDPLQLVSETTNARIVALRNDLVGEFNDRVTRLLSEFFIGQLTLRVWWGTPERPRWLHIDDFLVDDEEFRGPEVGIPCLGVTCLERGKLPVYDDATQSVTPLVYANESLQAVYDDLLTRVGVSARFLGPGVQDAQTLVSKVLDDSEAKAELDAICFLDGSARISSQGRIKAVRMFGPKAIARQFSRPGIKWTSSTPGFRQRVPEVRVPWNWDEGEQRYLAEFKAAHAQALLRLGKARIDPPALLPDEATRWIASNTLAERVGNRHVTHFGTGLMLWYFRSEFPEPQLEPGDCVVVPTSRFAGRDPNAVTAIKPGPRGQLHPVTGAPVGGNLWALGVIAAASEDFCTFALWVRSYADLLGGAVTAAGSGREGFGTRVNVSKWFRRGDNLNVTWNASDTGSVKIATSTSSQPAPGTGTTQAGGSGVADLGAFTHGVDVYVTITPYSEPSAGGVAGPAYQAIVVGQFRMRCKALGATQSSTSGAQHALACASEEFDIGGLHDNSTNNSRITIPTGGDDGVWLFKGEASFDVHATGIRGAGIRRNGSTFIGLVQLPPVAAGILAHQMQVVAMYEAPAVGDYFELMTFQNTGGALNVAGKLEAIQLW